MSDCGSIKLDYGAGTPPIYYYAHHEGYQLAALVHKGIKRGKDWWGDAEYLARILFCDLVEGDERRFTGFGIAPYETDSDYPIINVNLNTLQVTFLGGEPEHSWTFQEYVDMDEGELMKLHQNSDF